MASKQQKKGMWDKKKTVFADVKLDDDQDKRLKADTAFKSVWFKFFDAITADGLKFSAKWDDFNDCGQATLTKEAGYSDEATIVWVMRASSVSVAALKLAYLYHCTDGTLPVPKREKRSVGDEAEEYF